MEVKECGYDCKYFRDYGITFGEDDDYYSYECELDENNPIDIGNSDDGITKDVCEYYNESEK